jgi:hypothetical protein
VCARRRLLAACRAGRRAARPAGPRTPLPLRLACAVFAGPALHHVRRARSPGPATPLAQRRGAHRDRARPAGLHAKVGRPGARALPKPSGARTACRGPRCSSGFSMSMPSSAQAAVPPWSCSPSSQTRPLFTASSTTSTCRRSPRAYHLPTPTTPPTCGPGTTTFGSHRPRLADVTSRDVCLLAHHPDTSPRSCSHAPPRSRPPTLRRVGDGKRPAVCYHFGPTASLPVRLEHPDPPLDHDLDREAGPRHTRPHWTNGR